MQTSRNRVPETADSGLGKYLGGAVGAGLVLVVVPCTAMYLGMDRIAATPVAGLPILAIFGIMILFGALALVSALFQKLGLDDPTQALALPEGSVRAAIALSLIVLFAIISIMLYQSESKPYVIEHLNDADKTTIVTNMANRVIAIVPEPCAKPLSAKCAAEDLRYSVHVLAPQSPESTDLAKQLLILIGTLMTSVTSFYFASRAVESRQQTSADNPDSAADLALAGDHADNDHLDGCSLPIVNATADKDLPAAKGGVSK